MWEQTNEPRQGAAYTRRISTKNPMEILVGLIEGNPTADASQLFDEWIPIIREDDALLEAALRHTFANLYNALKRPPKRKGRHPTQTVEQRQEQVAKSAKLIVQVMLMNITLPSGKKLAEATFKECAEAGGWFARVAKKGKPSEIVGRVLTEQDLRKI